MDRKPFLDKISTAPHVPSQEGQYGLVSLKHFPDLSHTGIRCKFEKQVPYATAKDGRILPSYKAKAFRTTRLIERGLVELNAREDVFKTGHKQFIDKVLCDMEDTKRDKYKRQMKHWNSGKDKLGFSGSFNSMNASALESFTNLPTIDTEIGDRAEEKIIKTPSSPMSNDDYNDNDFEEHEEKPKPITHHSKSDGRMLGKKTPERRLSAFGEKSMHSVAFTAMSEATTQKRNNSAKDERFPRSIDAEGAVHYSKNDNFGGVVATKKPSLGFNTIAMFNNLMEITPPPSPTKRYGSLAPTFDPDHRP